jgi:hypothetical protein
MLNHTLNRLDVELPGPLAELSITFRCRGYLADLSRLLETADSRYVYMPEIFYGIHNVTRCFRPQNFL